MPKKQKSKNTEADQIAQIVKKIKSSFVEIIIREWLNSPCRSWGNKTVLQMVKAGKGQEILDAIKKSEEEMKEEREQKEC